MNPPTSSDALSRNLAAAQAELEGLDKRYAELQSALDDVEHDSRRCSDALERAGWRSGDAEARGAMLAESHEAIVSDQTKNRELHAQLTRRLELIRKLMIENQHDD